MATTLHTNEHSSNVPARVVPPTIYGLMAEFKEPEDILAAAEKTYAAGYRKMDAYTPFPVHGLHDAIGFEDNKLPWMIFFGGILGALTGGTLQVVLNTTDAFNFGYPWNIGGKPFLSWPAFIPVTYELTILFASLTAVFGMILLNGLPRPYHPVFNAPRFELASQDRFFLCIEAIDPQFDIERTRLFLENLHPSAVSEVEK